MTPVIISTLTTFAFQDVDIFFLIQTMLSHSSRETRMGKKKKGEETNDKIRKLPFRYKG